MGVQNPRKYTPEFKRQAVALAQELGSAPKAAERLGVSESNIHNWRVKLKAGESLVKQSLSHANQGAPPESPEEELKRLRRENQQLQKANYILKQAAAFFSQDHLK
jgi:transposase